MFGELWRGKYRFDAYIRHDLVKLLKGNFAQNHVDLSDEGFDKIGKKALDHFSMSLMVFKMFAFKAEKLVI